MSELKATSEEICKTCLGESDICNGLVDALERPLVHLEVVQIAAAEPRTPIVGSHERALLVEMDLPELPSLEQLPFVFY